MKFIQLANDTLDPCMLETAGAAGVLSGDYLLSGFLEKGEYLQIILTYIPSFQSNMSCCVQLVPVTPSVYIPVDM